MDNIFNNGYDSNFDWRWRLESIQPGGPTGANIGNLLQDLRTVWHGGQANAVNNELAQNAAYRKELGSLGENLNNVADKVNEMQFRWGNDNLQRSKNQTAKINAYNEAIKMYMEAPTEESRELAKESIRANFPDKADEIFAVAEANKQKIAQQSDNYVRWFNTLPSDFETEEEKTMKRNELDELRKNKAIDEKQYAEGSRKIEGMIPKDVQTTRTVKSATDSKLGKDVVEKNDKTLFDVILKGLPKNLSKSMRTTQAKKLFREKYGRDYTGE